MIVTTMCAERSSVELIGCGSKPKSHRRKQCLKGHFVVANLTACRATEALEHQASKEPSRNAKPEMVSVNGIELRQPFECGGLAIMRT